MTDLSVESVENSGAGDTGSDDGAFSLDSMRLQLDQFEGPFEVLLYLIKEQEIDIFDIPILQVTRQYLSFLDMLRTEQLDVAGDFLILAATLIQIKSRMILPAEMEQDEEEDLEEEDPRLDLVIKLLEYRKFRDLAHLLGTMEERQGDRFGRRVKPVYIPDENEEDAFEVSLYDLMKSIRGMLRFLMGEIQHRVTLEEASVDEKIARLENLLEMRESVSWSDLRQECRSPLEQVCFLLAILEMCRMHRLRVRQYASFGEIRLFAHDGALPESPEPEENVAVL
ncbi:MAG TPA: segregation/condensation protein A [Candidatus Hydrogenedentes bacterium]|jgi:segregation and condensation protein A|nr:MAG: Segregation and condensation protein A [Candidatus Hydrogenedentes bacterium ADurb.Bin170]HOM49093.1 segregation/condensation protein A [Candidatus Hydrogenedentota bacterium]HPX85773.1 segregation/condensation protein A [Candidatus Hydrogenedentota bacterium]